MATFDTHPVVTMGAYNWRTRCACWCLLALVSVGCDSSAPATLVEDDAQFELEAHGSTSDWPQMGRSPRRAFFNPYEDVLNAHSLPGLHKEWDVGVDADSVVQRDGQLFTQSVNALSLLDGDSLWSSPAFSGTPTVSAAGVFVSASGFDLDGIEGGKRWIQVLNRQSGELTAELARDYVPEGMRPYQTPLLYRQRLYTVTDDFVDFCGESGCFEPVRPTVAATDVERGLVWSTQLPPEIGLLSAANGRLFFSATFSGGGATTGSLSAETGETLWSVGIGSSAQPPAILQGRVYVVHGEHLIALDERSGSVLWDREVGSNAHFAVSFERVVVVVASSGSAELQALDPMTGVVLTVVALGAGTPCAPPAVTADVAYIALSDRLAAVGLHDGRLLVQVNAPFGQCPGSPVVTRGHVLVPSHSKLFSFGLGSTIERTYADGPSFDPSTSDDARYIAFVSQATGLAPGSDPANRDVYLADRMLHSIRQLSAPLAGSDPLRRRNSSAPMISGNGKDVVLLDRNTQRLEQVSLPERHN